MSSPELEICKGLIEGFNVSTDPSDEELEAAVDPGIEIHEEPDLPGGRIWRGYDGVRGWLADMRERWSEIDVDVEEWVERPSLIVMLGSMQATGKGAGVPVSAPLGQVFQFSGGRMLRIRYFRDHAQARDAAASIETEPAGA